MMTSYQLWSQQVFIFKAQSFFKAITLISRIQVSFSALTQVSPQHGFAFPSYEFEEVTTSVQELRDVSAKMGLSVGVTASAERLLAVLSKFGSKGYTKLPAGSPFDLVLPMQKHEATLLVHLLREIQSRIEDEISAPLFLQLSAEEATRYQIAEPPFGVEVANAFPNAIEDIEEANKCIALGRYTASVFHLMRAMECAVQALSAKLAIANIGREWGKLLSDMHSAIEVMSKGAERDKWSQSHSHLYHVKQAWRNDVMHPKATYTPEQASEVFSAVRSFMKHLANLI